MIRDMERGLGVLQTFGAVEVVIACLDGCYSVIDDLVSLFLWRVGALGVGCSEAVAKLGDVLVQ